jgi:hypothetical protein
VCRAREVCWIGSTGSGQEGNVRLSPEAEDYFAKKGCEVLLQPTQKAISSFNQSAKPQKLFSPQRHGEG